MGGVKGVCVCACVFFLGGEEVGWDIVTLLMVPFLARVHELYMFLNKTKLVV